MTDARQPTGNPFRPVTSTGTRATVLLGVSLVALALFSVAVTLGVRGGQTLLDAPLLTIPILICAGTAIAAMVSGVDAIVRGRDVALPVIVAILFGLLVSVFILGEVITPH